MNSKFRVTDRRRFIKQALTLGAVCALPGGARAGARRPHWAHRPVRVRGRVQAEGRGIEGVAVSDGRTITETGDDGVFELLADADRPFVFLSLPSGYAIPQNAAGTARFYEPLRASPGGEQSIVFDLEPMRQSDERHAFLALTDPQTRDAEEMARFHNESVPDVQDVVRTLGGRAAFGVSVGDIMYDDLSLYPDYERAVSNMDLPFFQVVGNHDLDFDGTTDAASTRTFRDHFGPTYYSFNRGAVHYVALDDVFWHHAGYLGYLDDVQLEWLRQDLARVGAGRRVVVFQHIPSCSTRYEREGRERPSIGRSVTNREALYRLLEPFKAHIISGHVHENEHLTQDHGVHEHVCGTVCGAWWSGPICDDGTPNGYAVYEVNGEDLQWRYKSTGYALDHQLRVHAPGADPEAPTELVANVWNWDPEWKVMLYEDGIRAGQMERRTGVAPLARRLRNRPAPTHHLFYAVPSPGVREVRVEATDRFGQVYSAATDMTAPSLD